MMMMMTIELKSKPKERERERERAILECKKIQKKNTGNLHYFKKWNSNFHFHFHSLF